MKCFSSKVVCTLISLMLVGCSSNFHGKRTVAHTENDAQVPTTKVRSCSEEIKEISSSTADFASQYIGMGFFATPLAIALPCAGSGICAVVVAGTYVATSVTAAAISVHRDNILDIFRGAETGGNKKTKKLWKIAKRRNPKVFSNVTYESFLNAIHKSDISGEACQFESIPERKDIIKVLVKSSELDTDTEDAR